MKKFEEILEPKDIITWEMLDFILSLETYSAQELKGVEAMINVCIAEVTAWKNVVTEDFIKAFSEKTFSTASITDVEKLENVVSMNHYMFELATKYKIAKHFSVLKTPACFLQ